MDYRFYKSANENGNYAGPEFTACSYVSLFLLLHMWILSLLLRLWGIVDIFESEYENITIAISLIVMGLVYLYFYYKKRHSKIIEKYSQVKEKEYKVIIFWCYVGISMITPFVLQLCVVHMRINR